MKLFLTPLYVLFISCRSFFIPVFLVYIFNPSFAAPTLSGESIWMGSETLPNARTEVTASNLDEAVYVIGGFTFEGKITDIVEMYSSTDNT
jgi:hypothetical protein